ncbi:unnamed protein product [Effrenium voratum]|nr:unnamed protein product [Effrenium voratum]
MFPRVDVSQIKHEEDPTSLTVRESHLEMAQRAHDFLLWLRSRPEKEIVVGTHSGFLMALFNVALDVADESKSYFQTGELRSVVVDFSALKPQPVPPPEAAEVPKVKLRNGVEVPMIGYGTAYFYDDLRRPEVTYRAFHTALEVGYRHVDSATMYGNERQVGAVLGSHFMQGALSREEVFVTTKVAHMPVKDYPNAQTSYIFDSKSAFDGVLKEFYQSLSDLGLGYVDLLLRSTGPA